MQNKKPNPWSSQSRFLSVNGKRMFHGKVRLFSLLRRAKHQGCTPNDSSFPCNSLSNSCECYLNLLKLVLMLSLAFPLECQNFPMFPKVWLELPICPKFSLENNLRHTPPVLWFQKLVEEFLFTHPNPSRVFSRSSSTEQRKGKSRGTAEWLGVELGDSSFRSASHSL